MCVKFEKLYEMTFPLTEDRAALYLQGFYRNREDGGVYVNKDYYVDLGTYFNLFSVKKWVEYTTITKLQMKLDFIGKFSVEFYGMSLKQNLPDVEEETFFT